MIEQQLYGEWLLGSVYHHVRFEQRERRIDALNRDAIRNSLVERIHSIVYLAFVPLALVFSAINTVIIAKTLRREYACSWTTVAKIEFLYWKTFFLGLSQVFLNVVLPELMLTNTCDLTKYIRTSWISFIRGMIPNLSSFFRHAGVMKELLPDQGAAMNNFRIQEEIEQAFPNEYLPVEWDCSHYLQQRMIQYYSQDEIRLASWWSERSPFIHALLNNQEASIALFFTRAELGHRVGDAFILVDKKFGRTTIRQIVELMPILSLQSPQIIRYLIDKNYSDILECAYERFKVAIASDTLHRYESRNLFILACQKRQQTLAAMLVPVIDPAWLSAESMLQLSLEAGLSETVGKLSLRPKMLITEEAHRQHPWELLSREQMRRALADPSFDLADRTLYTLLDSFITKKQTEYLLLLFRRMQQRRDICPWRSRDCQESLGTHMRQCLYDICEARDLSSVAELIALLEQEYVFRENDWFNEPLIDMDWYNQEVHKYVLEKACKEKNKSLAKAIWPRIRKNTHICYPKILLEVLQKANFTDLLEEELARNAEVLLQRNENSYYTWQMLSPEKMEQVLTTIDLSDATCASLVTAFIEKQEPQYALQLLRRLPAPRAHNAPMWWQNSEKRILFFKTAIEASADEVVTYIIPYIDLDCKYDYMSPLEIAIKEQRKDVVQQFLAVMTGIHDPKKDVHLLSRMESGFGFEFMKMQLGDITATNCGLHLELVNKFIQDNKIAQAEKLLSQVLHWSTTTQFSLQASSLFFSELFRSAVEKKAYPLAKLIMPHLAIGCIWRADGTTVLMHAALAHWKEGVQLLLSRGALLQAKDNNKKTAWKYIASQFSIDEQCECLSQLSLDEEDRRQFLEEMYGVKNCTIVDVVLGLLRSLPDTKKPSWWTDTSKMTDFYIVALCAEREEDCALFLPYVDVDLEDTEQFDNWTPLMWCVNYKNEKQILALIQKGAKLHAIHAKGKSVLQEIFATMGKDFVTQKIVPLITKERLCAKNKQGCSLLACLTLSNDYCGSLVNVYEEFFVPYGIPKSLLTITSSLRNIFKYVCSPAYQSLQTVTEEKKREILLLFAPEAAQAAFAHLQFKETDPNHMRYKFSSLCEPTVKNLPTSFSLSSTVAEVLAFVEPLWPDSLSIQDDAFQRTKREILQKIQGKMKSLEQGTLEDQYSRDINRENQNTLRAIYGNIFKNIIERIAAQKTKSAKEKEAFEREVKSFIQSLGITFYHCSDRLMSDSRRFYLRFVDNVKTTIEEEENIAIQECLHKELLRLRREVFNEVYFSIDTDMHDVATQRYIENHFNHELGLHLPEFNDKDSYQRYALQDKVLEVNQRFYAAYTPTRIVKHLQKIIATAIREQALTGAKQSWFCKIYAFLECGHAQLDMNVLYDEKENSFTSYGIEMLLEDLHILQDVR